MGRHDATALTKARDELMSHIVRCEVLDAIPEHRFEWLGETMDYMAGRYPQLSDLELARLEGIGKQYLSPAIDHGATNNAVLGRTDEAPTDRKAPEAASAGESSAEETPEEVDAPADEEAPDEVPVTAAA